MSCDVSQINDHGSLTNEHEVNSDANFIRQPETVATEQHQVADDAEIADAIKQHGSQDRAGREARPNPAAKRRRTAGQRRRRGPGKAVAAWPAKISRLERTWRRQMVVVESVIV